MSKRLSVVTAVMDLVRRALPDAEVLGLNRDADKLSEIPPGGQAIVREGDPGEASIDLSPPVYIYNHQIPVEVSALGVTDGSPTNSEALDAMLVALGDAIDADRFLGGRVDWLDVLSVAPQIVAGVGTISARAAEITVVATYSTTNPLT